MSLWNYPRYSMANRRCALPKQGSIRTASLHSPTASRSRSMAMRGAALLLPRRCFALVDQNGAIIQCHRLRVSPLLVLLVAHLLQLLLHQRQALALFCSVDPRQKKGKHGTTVIASASRTDHLCGLCVSQHHAMSIPQRNFDCVDLEIKMYRTQKV